MNNWMKRSISGVILIAIMLAAILWNEYSALLLTLFLFTFSFNEFRSMFKIKDQILSVLLMIIGQIALVFFYLFTCSYVEMKWLTFLLVGAITIIVLAYLIFKGTSFREFGLLLFGTFWFAGTLSFFLSTGWIEKAVYSPRLLIILLIFIWINDIGAFVFGSLFGKKTLAPNISPGKTIEGFVAGIILNGIAGYIIYIITNTYSSFFWIILGMLMSVTATAGDLFESKLKREAGVKDSGSLIPGHGGILDRFDSLMFSTPLYYAVFLIWNLR